MRFFSTKFENAFYHKYSLNIVNNQVLVSANIKFVAIYLF